MKKIAFSIVTGFACLLLMLSVNGSFAQDPGTPAYDQAKEAGTLPQHPQVPPTLGPITTIVEQQDGNRAGGFWIPLDGTFTLAMSPNDDGSSAEIPLSFTFCFYETDQTSLFINNNGNVSFGEAYWEYVPTGFPSSDYIMIAPFWGDVDTRTCVPGGGSGGDVWYKSESNRIIIIWDNTGYYDQHCDLRNTFQLILTDGTDPTIGIGNNVGFAYEDMQWTTGDASGGSGGFGGSAATVGINKGDGSIYALVGRFDHAGSDYDGPGGAVDGVSYLDGKQFTFSTCTFANVPPVPIGFPAATIVLNVGDTWTSTVQFIPPEVEQTVTTVVTAPTLPTLSALITNGNLSTIDLSLVATAALVGVHTIQFVATDNFNPTPGVTTQYIVLEIQGASPETPVSHWAVIGTIIAILGTVIVLLRRRF